MYPSISRWKSPPPNENCPNSASMLYNIWNVKRNTNLQIQWNLDYSKSKGPNSFVWIIETLNNQGLKCIHIFQFLICFVWYWWTWKTDGRAFEFSPSIKSLFVYILQFLSAMINDTQYWLLCQKAITTPMRKSLDKQYCDNLYLSMKTAFVPVFINEKVYR